MTSYLLILIGNCANNHKLRDKTFLFNTESYLRVCIKKPFVFIKFTIDLWSHLIYLLFFMISKTASNFQTLFSKILRYKGSS